MVSAMPISAAGMSEAPVAAANRAATHAPQAANPYWARESCPLYPVTTMTDSTTIEAAIVTVNAEDQFAPASRLKTAPAASQPAMTAGRIFPEPTLGSRSASLERADRSLPRMISTTMTRMNGAASDQPGWLT